MPVQSRDLICPECAGRVPLAVDALNATCPHCGRLVAAPVKKARCGICERPFEESELRDHPGGGAKVCPSCFAVVSEADTLATQPPQEKAAHRKKKDERIVAGHGGGLGPLLEEMQRQTKLLELIRENTFKARTWLLVLGVVAILGLIGGCIAALGRGP